MIILEDISPCVSWNRWR